jgi:pilus assembly protein FimV
MPLLFVFIIAVLVNFSSPLLAQENTTQIRGPRGSDAPPPAVTIGPLSPSDTLWRVAERVKPEGNISLYQVMYAIYLKNPDAFIDGNLNRLRPGSTLTLPTEAEIQQVDLAVARRKSEQDDVIWAERQKAAATRKAATTTPAAKPDSQWQAELERIGRQQREELDGLRSQFADSMQVIESISDENLQLKTSLGRVQQELELIKAQLGEDSELQQQISLLLKQQAELLQAKADEEALLQQQQSSNWQQWFKNPLAWILAACIPALLILFSILLWVKKRGRQTEEVIQAATTEKAVDPGYHSPLPPLDESNDLDESLFEIDDALLEDAFSDGSEFTDATADDDMLQFDDGLSFEDDSLLPAVDDGFANDILSEPDTAEKEDFDADNILSDTDLSALLAAEDDDDIAIELADNMPQAQPGDELQQPAADDVDVAGIDDSALDESAIDEFDIDELIEEIDFDAEDVLATDDTPVETAIEQPDDKALQAGEATQQEQQLAEAMAAETADPETAEYSFDSSGLDEFAESLVTDHAAADTETDSDDNDAAALLSAELTELLEQVEDSRPATEPDVVTSAPEPALTVPEPSIPALSEPELSESELSAPDMLLQDDEDTDPDVEDSALAALDLTASEDDSVVRPGEAALSVENPSKILPEYPQLELTDDELLSDIELLSADIDDTAVAPDIAEIELDPLPDAQFDSLMSELEAMADAIDANDTATAQPDTAELLVNDLATAQQDSAQEFNFAEDDFVEIDKLLADAGQQEQDIERFDKLNVDVGLDDYAGIIGEHEQRDVDTEDNGYAAKLDLVRAYIEIDDRESANLLLDEILAADVPDNIKTEAQKLKQED